MTRVAADYGLAALHAVTNRFTCAKNEWSCTSTLQLDFMTCTGTTFTADSPFYADCR